MTNTDTLEIIRPENWSEARGCRSLFDFIGKSLAVLWKDWPIDMEIVSYVDDQGKFDFSLDGICPHHCAHVTFNRVSSLYVEPSDSKTYPYRYCRILRCPGCRKYVLAVARRNHDSAYFYYEAHYPIGEAPQWSTEHVPAPLLANFNEAVRCNSVQAYNAAAEMCRRAIEGSCIMFGAPRKLKDIKDKINWLVAERKITPFLGEVADKIRLGGNRAAHFPEQQQRLRDREEARADEDELTSFDEEAIGEEQARAIIEFTRDYFQHVYVVQKQLGKYDFSKSGPSKDGTQNNS